MAGPWDVVGEAPVAPAPAARTQDPWAVVAEAPVAPPVPPLAPGPVSSIFISPDAIPQPVATPSIADRFRVNMRDAFDSTALGETINRVQSGQVAKTAADDMERTLTEARARGSAVGLDNFSDGRPNPYAQMPLVDVEKLRAPTAAEADKRAGHFALKRGVEQNEMDTMPSFTQADGVVNKIVQGIVALSGQLVGGAGSPENLIGGPGGKVVREVGENVIKYGARRAVPGAAEGAAGAAAANPMVQQGRTERGEQAVFSGGELAENVVLGAGVGAAFRLAAPVAKGVIDFVARKRGVAPDRVDPASVGPSEYELALQDPQVAELAKANGIDTAAPDNRVLKLRDKLEERREADRFRTGDGPDSSITAQDKEALRRQREKSGVEGGDIDPAATNLRPHSTDDTPIRVDSSGGAFRADDGALAGRDKSNILETADRKALPAPGRAVPTEEEIARTRAASERGNAPDVDTPPTLYGQETRAPQTSDDLVGQRQAGEAFTLAQRQKVRVGPDVRDTQPGGRPQGRGDAPVFMDEGHPVEVINRRMIPDSSGRMTEVATVRRYDPRTGAPEPDGIEYDVPVRQLKNKNYAPDPRQAQDFEARAETDRINAGRDRGKRMDDAQGLERQTYRQTPPDVTADGMARAARPDQPAGPHPGRRWSTAEEAMRDFADRQTRGEAGDIPPKGSYKKTKTSSKAAPADKDGRFKTMNDYVASDAGGPVRFANQRQAANWIINVGHKKSPDQIFEIANHPSGKGFTARERGRNAGPESPPPSGSKKGEASGVSSDRGVDTGPQRRLSGPPQSTMSFSEKIKATREDVWDDKSVMGGSRRGVGRNERFAEDTARERVMRDEAREHIRRSMDEDGLTDDLVPEVARHYRRADGETVDQAWSRAVDRWVETNERNALRDDGAGQDVLNHDWLARENSDPETARLLDTYTGGRQNEPAPKSEEIPFGERSESGPATRAGKDDIEPEVGKPAERRGEDARADAADAGPDGGRQTVIPGAERISGKQLAERQGQKPLKGGSEPPPKGGLFDEDARSQSDIFDPKSTFHSNPLFDPQAWKWFGKALGFDEKWRREISELFSDVAAAREGRGEKTGRAGDFGRLMFYSTDGALRALGKVYDDSPTIKRIADMLFAPADAGRGGAVTRTFTEAVNARANRNINELARIMGPFSGNKDVVSQVVRLVQNPHRINEGTPIHDAAAALRKLLEDEHKYLKTAGIDVGYQKGYFPRELDVTKVLANPIAFRAAAIRAYRAAGLGGKEAAEAADNWFERVALGGVNVRPDGTDFVSLSGSPTRDFAKGRTLTKAADEILSAFYHTDPLEMLTVHFQRTSRRAEWASRFGDDLKEWKKLKQAMIDEGNAAAIPEVVRAISSSTGASPVVLPSSASAVVGFLRTYGVIRLLPRATITSLSESLLPTIRSGSGPAAALSNIVKTTRALWERSGKLGEAREFAEDLGLIMRGTEMGLLASRFNALDPTNRAHERTLNRFFRATGLEQYTAATRVTAVTAAETFIRRLALDVTGNKARQASARSLLTELGVKDVDGFAKWVSDNREGPLARDFDVTAGHDATYRDAVVRFVNQAIMSPSASTRPRWANHPLGSLVFMLQSYAYAFHKNVLIRSKDLAVQAATGEGYGAADRARMLAPIAMLPALVAIQMGVAPLRQAVFGTAGKDTKTEEEKETQLILQAISRSGLTGAWDAVFNLFSGAKYHRDAATSALGPVVGGSLTSSIDVLMALAPPEIGGANSPKTNTAERNAARSLYEMIVAPAAVFGASLLPGPIGAVGAQVPGLSSVRDAFRDGVAGPEQTRGGRGRPARAGRER